MLSLARSSARLRPLVVPFIFSQFRILPFRSAFTDLALKRRQDDLLNSINRDLPEHAVISTFDLFSIGGA